MESCGVRVSGEGSQGDGQSHFLGLVEVEEEEEEEEMVVLVDEQVEGLTWLPSSQVEFPIPGSSVPDF